MLTSFKPHASVLGCRSSVEVQAEKTMMTSMWDHIFRLEEAKVNILEQDFMNKFGCPEEN